MWGGQQYGPATPESRKLLQSFFDDWPGVVESISKYRTKSGPKPTVEELKKMASAGIGSEDNKFVDYMLQYMINNLDKNVEYKPIEPKPASIYDDPEVKGATAGPSTYIK